MIYNRLLIIFVISWSSLSFSAREEGREREPAALKTVTAGAGDALVPATFSGDEWAEFEKACQAAPMKNWVVGMEFTPEAARVCKKRLKGDVKLSFKLFLVNSRDKKNGLIVPLTIDFKKGEFVKWIKILESSPGLEADSTLAESGNSMHKIKRFFPPLNILSSVDYYKREGYQIGALQEFSLVLKGDDGISTPLINYNGSTGVHSFSLSKEFFNPSFLKINFELIPGRDSRSMRLSFQPSLVNLNGDELRSKT